MDHAGSFRACKNALKLESEKGLAARGEAIGSMLGMLDRCRVACRIPGNRLVCRRSQKHTAGPDELTSFPTNVDRSCHSKPKLLQTSAIGLDSEHLEPHRF